MQIDREFPGVRLNRKTIPFGSRFPGAIIYPSDQVEVPDFRDVSGELGRR